MTPCGRMSTPTSMPPFVAFAHRGGATYPPNLHRENSRHAFAEAVALGYRYLETDVHATADGVLLAFHDSVLDRVTDRMGAIAELPYAEVAEARIGGIDPIPRLGELFEAFPDARFNIDAKSNTAVDLLAETIAEHDAYDRVCVSFVRDPPAAPAASPARPAGRFAPPAPPGVAINRFAALADRGAEHPAPVLQMPTAPTRLAAAS